MIPIQFFTNLFVVNVLHLTDGGVGVASRHGVDRSTHVDVVFLQAGRLRQIHGLPVPAGGGARQAGGSRRRQEGEPVSSSDVVSFLLCCAVTKHSLVRVDPALTWTGRTGPE